jgi:hypothetical protein
MKMAVIVIVDTIIPYPKYCMRGEGIGIRI